MYSDRIAMSPPFSEAAERNKAPILGALRRLLPERGRVLEIGSGTGQHAVHFAPAFPGLSWQPTEQREHLEGLNTRIRLEGPPNILPAIELDVTGPWPDYCFEAVYSSNTAHIMAWDMVQAMFAGVSERIAPGGAFCLYGPFNVDGEFTSASNQVFDRQLRERDTAMGLRDVRALSALAGEHLMRLAERCQLPANNQLLVFRRNERG
jgi:cyclopropane fatty-acyl-phospholipid synthase-like methyltransferase